MRRILALVLVALFSLQSSALAESQQSVTAPNVQPLLSAIEGSYIFALLTGNEGGYEAMHAPAPQRLQIRRDGYRPEVSRARFAQAIARYGQPGRRPAMGARIFSLKDAPRDPLAMKPSNPLPAPVMPPVRINARRGRANALSSRVATPYLSNLGSLSPNHFALLVGQSASYTLTNDGLQGGVDAQTGCGGIAAFSGYSVTAQAAGSCTATLYWSGPASQAVHGTATVTVTAPTPTPTPVPTPTPTPVPTPTPTPVPTPTPTPTPIPVTPTPSPTPTPVGTPLPPATTGVNRWWTYQEKPLAGVGKAMVNVANGNLLVQSDDIDIPERGIDLAFRRTYNSQSRHDASSTDGATPSLFGNGWTNTFDAHMGYDAATNTLSVYDIDGARYDYTLQNGSVWAPPPGMQGTTLISDGNCGFQWTKKTGTVYYFWRPDVMCSAMSGENGYLGRLYEIIGRNHTNYIQFSYTWDSSGEGSAENVASITAMHSDGQSLTMTFSQFGSYTELASITRPDNQTITYNYDANGNLIAVTRPGNATDDATRTASITSLQEQYWYFSGTHELQSVAGPRYVWDQANTPGSPDGSYYDFNYSANTTSGLLTSINDYAVVNPTPNDTTGYPLQSGVATGFDEWHTDSFSYGSQKTTFSDTDGHSSIWSWDTSARVTESQEWTSSEWLVSTATWDADNDLTATVDPRGAATGSPSTYETDYAYDANGNLIAEAAPAITTSAGTIRPTSLYSYDSFNNVTAYCDPVFANASGLNWTAPPAQSDTLCPNAAGATRYSYDNDTNPGSDTNEPFGELTNSYSPCYGGSCAHAGKHEAYAYNASSEGGSADYGLPTSATQDCFTQYDSSQNCPQQTFTYDAHGNLVTYNPGNGAWSLTYDTDNRVTSMTDADGVTSRKCYYADSSVRATQTAAQYAADSGVVCGPNSVSYRYDPDGNKLTEVHHYNNAAGTTVNWYDGDDRLVEVALPHDSTDYYSYQWLTRYIYDLTAGGTNTVGGNGGVTAHGDLVKTQEWFGPNGWVDTKGDAYDALDRNVHHYQHQPGTAIAATMPASTNYYDQSTATTGLLSQATDALSESKIPTYNADGSVINAAYSGDGGVTPSEAMTFDPDGRAVAITSSTLGTQSMSFDADGDQTTVQEASSGGVTSPATYTYAYYPNGSRAGLSVASSALNQQNLMQYAYRADGLRTGLAFADGSTTASFAWTRKASGRVTTISDSSGEPARNLSYDSYGRVTSDQMAAGTTSPITYDAENEVTGYTAPGTSFNQFTLTYTVRGELGSQVISGAPCASSVPQDADAAPIYQQGANGYMVSYNPNTSSCGPNTPPTYDQVAGVSTGNESESADGSTFDTTSYSFDAAGRQNAGTANWQYTYTCGDTQCSTAGNGPQTRSYDAENHLIGESVSDWEPQDVSSCSNSRSYPVTGGSAFTGTLTYSWGPNGHPDTFVQTGATTYTLHWDGDTPLFATNSSGAVVEVKVEGLGFFAPGTTHPMTYLDRNQSGFVVAAHWSGGTSSWTPAGPTHETCTNQALSGAVFFEPGSDGITDGVNTFQGVRAYDPALGTWTSPDAYAGDVTDPMSRKSYMWNDNNPVAYQDPSGYEGFCPGCLGLPHDYKENAEAETNAYMVLLGIAMMLADIPATRVGGGGGVAVTDEVAGLPAATFMGVLREASEGEIEADGTFTADQASALGEAWVGPGARTFKNGTGLISKDGLRAYRFPALKKNGVRSGYVQANLEKYDQYGNKQSNTHLTVVPNQAVTP